MGGDVESEPYEFRFHLDRRTRGPGDRQALVDFVREQVKNLLIVAELTYQGQPVAVDGFRLYKDLDTWVPLDEPDTASASS